MLNKFLSALAFIAALFGLYQRNRADRAEAEAQHQSDRADAAQAESDVRKRVNKWTSLIRKKHRQEQIDAQQRMDDGRRDHLDNNGQ